MILYSEECQHAGFDPSVIEKYATRLEKIAKELRNLDITIFGGSGTGSLRYNDGDSRPLILASSISTNIDGGDGACDDHGPDGLMRGE